MKQLIFTPEVSRLPGVDEEGQRREENHQERGQEHFHSFGSVNLTSCRVSRVVVSTEVSIADAAVNIYADWRRGGQLLENII